MPRSILNLIPLCLLGACASNALDRSGDVTLAPSASLNESSAEPLMADASSPVSAADMGLARAMASNPSIAEGLVTQAQEQDYSPSSLFSQHHGEFYEDFEPFRENIRLTFRGQTATQVDGESGHFDLWGVGIEGNYDMVIDPDIVLTMGARHETRRYNYNSNFAGPDQDEYMRELSLHAGVGVFVNDDLYVSGSVVPGIFSDMQSSLNSRDWQLFGRSLATFRYADELYLKGGVYIDQTFRDLPVYPVLGMAWLFHPDWRLDVLLPRDIMVTWNYTPEFSLNGGADLRGNQYNFRSDLSTGKTEYKLTTQEFNLFVGANYRFDENLSIFGRVGGVLFGDSRFPGPTGNSKGQLEPSLFFEAGVGWTF